MINVSDKAMTLPSDTLIATAYFPCQYLYLHTASDKMLKDTETFKQDCLHTNLHQIVVQQFSSKARQTDKVVSLDSHILDTDVANPTLPEASQGQTAIEKEEVGTNPDQKQQITADKVTAFNDGL